MMETHVAMPSTMAQQAALSSARSPRGGDDLFSSSSSSSGSGTGVISASNKRTEIRKVKVLLMGDVSTNKSQVLASYGRAIPKLAARQLPVSSSSSAEGEPAAVPAALEGELLVDGRPILVELVDVPPLEAAIAACMPLTTLFIIFFSIVDPESFANAFRQVGSLLQYTIKE